MTNEEFKKSLSVIRYFMDNAEQLNADGNELNDAEIKEVHKKATVLNIEAAKYHLEYMLREIDPEQE